MDCGLKLTQPALLQLILVHYSHVLDVPLLNTFSKVLDKFAIGVNHTLQCLYLCLVTVKFLLHILSDSLLNLTYDFSHLRPLGQFNQSLVSDDYILL